MLLDHISNTTFRYKDILELDPDMSYQELHDLLEQWEAEGRICPVKRQGKTSFHHKKRLFCYGFRCHPNSFMIE